MLDPNVFSRYKTKQDFDREAQEFEARKRQQALQEQLGQIQLQQAQAQMNQPSVPFQGTSFDAQIANEAYRFNLGKGMDEATARQRAVDMVLGSKTDYSQVTDPYTGQTSIVPRPRQGIFGQAQPQAQGQMPSMATPTFSPAPMPAAPSMQVRAVAPDMAAQMPAPVIPAQGVPLDPRALTAPSVQMDIAKKTLDPKFQAQQQEKQQKEQAQKQLQSKYGNVVTNDILRILQLRQSRSLPDVGTAALPTSLVGETEAGQIRSLLQGIEPNIAFNRLSEMRQSSPTGGAVGQLTDAERKALGNTLGSISQFSDPKLFDENLKRIYNQFMDTIHGTPDQIRVIGLQKGLPQKDINEISFRFPLKMDAISAQELSGQKSSISLEEFLNE